MDKLNPHSVGLLPLDTLNNRLLVPIIFTYNSTATLSLLLLPLFYTPFDSPKHLSRQHEIDRPEKWARKHAKHTRSVIDSRPQDQPRRVGIHLVQDEHPAKLSLNIHTRIVTQSIRNYVTHMRVGIESEYPVLLKDRHSEESCTRRSVEHNISNHQVLEFRDDSLSTWLCTDRVTSLLFTSEKGPEHLFHQAIPPFGVAVPAAAIHTHLH